MEVLSEKIKRLLSVNSGSGDGSGDGSGYGYGYGSGYGYGYGSGDDSGSGDGSGDGSGYGSGSGDGSGYGDGSGDGSGYGYGYGYGYGSDYGDGSGYGYGDGSGYGINAYNGHIVHMIDNVATIITRVIGNLAKGFMLNGDLTLTPCYIVKGNNLFAHGATAKEAEDALREKMFENMDTEQAIEMFLAEFDLGKKYPAKDFYVWHHRLTGSCEMGRKQFAKNHGIDLENGMYTVEEFIEITKNDYGGNVIRQLEERIKE